MREEICDIQWLDVFPDIFYIGVFVFITHNIEEAVYLSENILVLTNKPTTIKERLVNPLPFPRKITSPEFVDMRVKVTDLIKWW